MVEGRKGGRGRGGEKQRTAREVWSRRWEGNKGEEREWEGGEGMGGRRTTIIFLQRNVP